MESSPNYKPSKGVIFTQTKPAAHETLRVLANNCLRGYRIYQMLGSNDEKALGAISRDTFYVLVHPNPVETGILIFSPRHAPVFMHESDRRSYIIRMRLSSTMHAQTAIFSVSLDKSDGFLWLEDVVVWNGQSIHDTQTFTQRRVLLNQFLQHHWMPDARCVGGLNIRVANFLPLEALKNYKDTLDWTAIDLCPEKPGRRRFRLRAAGGTSANAALVAELKTVSGLPDVYELWSAENQCVGRAAVQEMSLSRTIRETMAAGNTKMYVEVAWNPAFSKFRIQKIVSSAVPRAPAARFFEISAKANNTTNEQE